MRVCTIFTGKLLDMTDWCRTCSNWGEDGYVSRQGEERVGRGSPEFCQSDWQVPTLALGLLSLSSHGGLFIFLTLSSWFLLPYFLCFSLPSHSVCCHRKCGLWANSSILHSLLAMQVLRPCCKPWIEIHFLRLQVNQKHIKVWKTPLSHLFYTASFQALDFGSSLPFPTMDPQSPVFCLRFSLFFPSSLSSFLSLCPFLSPPSFLFSSSH